MLVEEIKRPLRRRIPVAVDRAGVAANPSQFGLQGTRQINGCLLVRFVSRWIQRRKLFFLGLLFGRQLRLSRRVGGFGRLDTFGFFLRCLGQCRGLDAFGFGNFGVFGLLGRFRREPCLFGSLGLFGGLGLFGRSGSLGREPGLLFLGGFCLVGRLYPCSSRRELDAVRL